MSNKRKRAKLAEQKLKKLAGQGRLVHGIVIPAGAVAADLTRQAANSSYAPPLYYVDYSFTCVDCGSQEIWTALQQKWYYEVAKGPIQAKAIRCRACRKAHREMQQRSRAASRTKPDEGDS